jgi:2-dehydro-3-deoxy-D-arabinonate dehydratase
MQLCKVRLASGDIGVGALGDGQIHLFDLKDAVGIGALSVILHSEDPGGLARRYLANPGRVLALDDATLLAPIDSQEVWGAGVTYQRSQEARGRESVGAAQFYELVYSAPRPELFFKATARRVVGPGDSVHVRRDSHWTVPEPELALVISPQMQIVGYTIGNDMSARDIEGENPLYLPQAKVYDHSCALGPAITLQEDMPALREITLRMCIERGGNIVFEGTSSLGAMKRMPDELVSWLGRENSFPDGVVLLTGTGIVPPDEFTLNPGDAVSIHATGIGRLTNRVGPEASRK